jgi:hypothetical protein
MHTTLAEILENLNAGLLWVTHDGTVRFANAEGSLRTGLSTGGRLYDPDLLRAVTAAVAGRTTSQVASSGRPPHPGGPVPALACRVVPGLSRDDAFVFLRDEGGSDPGVAFRNLMQVIRTDLAAPLHDAHDALAALDGVAADTMAPLLQRVDDVTQVLDKLIDLAGIWSSGSLLANERIELWPLLQQAWAELQPLAQDRNVKVRFRSAGELGNLATLYGSENWLRRVFMECLEAAVREGRPGSTVLIEHRQMGPRAVVVFHDSGVFARAVREGVELAAPGRGAAPAGSAGRPPAREHISLQLCRHILSLHGGQLREEHEDGLRHFVIDLPTGAPAQTADPQLDMAQAQRYASDLAALMARARRQAAAH